MRSFLRTSIAVALVLSARSGSAGSLADATLAGEGNGDEFGWSVAIAGLVNADGIPDVLVGAPTNDAVAGFAGRAYLFHGLVQGTISATNADATFSGEAFGDNLGVAVAGGDVNGDGTADVILGARSNDGAGTQAGRVYVFLGPVSGSVDAAAADATISGAAFDELGWRVLAADFNDDLHDDLLIGAPKSDGAGFLSGEAALFLGPIAGDLSIADADARFQGVLDSETIGEALGAGDLNFDGTPDVVLGGPRFPLNGTDTGRAYVFFSPVSGVQAVTAADVILVGEGQNDAFGASVFSGADVDGDGREDLLVGADQEFLTTGAGKAYFFPGPIAAGTRSAATATAILTGETAGDQFGQTVAILPGVQAGSVVVGAPSQGAGGAAAGRAYVFTGALSGTVPASSATETVTGAAGEHLGHALATGDLDQSDALDMLIGLPAFSTTSPGLVYVDYGPSIVGVEPVTAVASGLGLRVRPNPTRGPATIAFALDRPARVALDVLDVGGRRVRGLDVGERLAGEHSLTWDGRDDAGRRVPAGVYFVRLDAAEESAASRVVLVD